MTGLSLKISITFFLSTSIPAAFAQTLQWYEIHDVGLYQNQVRDTTARFFMTRDRTKVMLSSENLGTALVLLMENTQFGQLPMDALSIDESKEIAVTDGLNSMTPKGRFIKQGPIAGIEFEGLRLVVAPKKPVIGETSLTALLDYGVSYRRLMDEYQPDPEMIEFLAKFKKPVEIEVGFGTWCAHCRRNLPKLMKVLALANNKNLSISYVGISRDLKKPESFIARTNIGTVPTIIVSHQGRELGRIVGKVKKSMETDLTAILLRSMM